MEEDYKDRFFENIWLYSIVWVDNLPKEMNYDMIGIWTWDVNHLKVTWVDDIQGFLYEEFISYWKFLTNADKFKLK